MSGELNLDEIIGAIESALKEQVSRLDEPRTREFHAMLTYHMGWSGPGASPEATGKRLRPLLMVLVIAGCGEQWLRALPAAAAVELVHNFSLVHDDIQDQSDSRRGRPTVWTQWGQPMGINVGDALFVLANMAWNDLAEHYTADTVLKAAAILNSTCLDLTRGQFLDMSYEQRRDLTVEDYWPMVTGKTAALLSACCHIGAVLGKADEGAEDAYRSFGHALGLAFQVQDDILGIWGDAALTGKSTASDLIARKKTLPVLFGLSKNGEFARRWNLGTIGPGEVENMANLLASEGAYEYTYDISRQMTSLALDSLRSANPHEPAGQALVHLANKLISRAK